jgi:hypothetical protein
VDQAEGRRDGCRLKLRQESWGPHFRPAQDPYPSQDGFGWTNGVMLKLMALYPADADLESADLCPAGHGS